MSIIPDNLKGKALFDFVVKNEDLILHSKKSNIKKADAVVFATSYLNEKGALVTKDESVTITETNVNKLRLKVVINTTNYMDSHDDVHIPNLWNKSIADNKKGFYLLQEHESCFEGVIGEGMKASVVNYAWSDLGFKLQGVTQALIFDGEIKKDRNPFMFDQYLRGYVKQHSVGMRYIKIVTCINDEDYPVQLENWNKYRPMVANGDVADEEGIFFAVLEAQIREGSAVLFGSNDVTPTMEIEYNSTEEQPKFITEDQPPKDYFKQWLENVTLIKN